ncbi:MAG: type II toxin-antitoxin system death-on-curing family toxin [Bacteroidetes bacterium]|nr:type II toxin-antitoxin system death-on-curing family toxin [Bacteroidota bacterium]
MIDLKTVENIHNILIDKFGGSKGIRDIASLEASLARPYATFDALDLYPGAIEKAAALFESLIIGHAFVDGNKRISYVLMRLVLLENQMDISASQDEKYSFVLSSSKGEYRYNEILTWLKNHIKNNG